jgi:2-polyprenyl-6-hydroxyphenyl methylase/3-demethylubiquinone-9 3-methyltransferase
MSNATPVESASGATIRPEEAAHFGKLAAEWWDPAGSSAMLHKLNPARLAFIRDAMDVHWQCDPRSVRPLAGKRALDVGCGAGLLCEPLARLGAGVTGVDAALENIAAASTHAASGGLAIDYRHGDLAALGLGQFDLVTAMEDFITPEELAELLSAQGLTMAPPHGIAWSPFKGLHLSDDLALNYIAAVTPAG